MRGGEILMGEARTHPGTTTDKDLKRRIEKPKPETQQIQTPKNYDSYKLNP